MTHVRQVVLGAVGKLSLQCLTKQWVEWFHLAAAHVNAADREGHAKFQALDVVRGLSSAFKKYGSKGPDINHPDLGGLGDEDLDRQ